MSTEKRSVVQKIDLIVFKAFKMLSYVSAISLVLVALVCTANVITTKLFKFGITNATEIVTYLNIPVVFCAIAFIQVERGHTTIDLLLGRFPAGVQRVINFLAYLLGCAVCAFIGRREIALTVEKFGNQATASAARNSFVIWPFVAIIAIGFITLAIGLLWSAIREFAIPNKEDRAGYMPPPTPAKFDENEKGEQL